MAYGIPPEREGCTEMCGLAGVVRLSGQETTRTAVTAALEALDHRGPDARQVWQEGPCTLLHCRLRIIDVAPRSDQPMMCEQGERVVMLYNGEIYNFRSLRDELALAGRTFMTTSDSEVLLAAYLRWGTDVFRRVRGMWAVAFWHPESRRLVLSRDPLGKKPLVYATNGSDGYVAFASTVTALLPLLDRTPAVDPSAVDCYLGHLAVPFEHSVFEGVHKVSPGSYVTWTPESGVIETRYWESPRRPVEFDGDAISEVERLLRQAIRRRLESDVPLGVFLSAGFDSGLVAALAAEESARPLVAVTAGTVGSGYDERELAQSIAEKYGLSHRPIEVPTASASSLPSLIGELGEPFGDASILPSFEVARAARREITVALTGDGGDESFFGYATFRAAQIAEHYRRWVPASVRRMLRDYTQHITTDSWGRRLGALFEYGATSLSDSFRNRMGFSRAERCRLLRQGQNPSGHVAEHIYEQRLRRWVDLPDADALRRTFFETFLPNIYLTKVDTATMAASLEARCPFLDIDLVEFMLRLPADVAFPGARLKALLRPLVRRYLPPRILNRPKTGFGVPVGQWLRGPLRVAFEEFVLRSGTLMTSLVDPQGARAFLEAHRRGADHSTRLWSLLALGVWSAVVVEKRWSRNDPLPMSEQVAA